MAIKLAANLSLMFIEWSFTDRFKAARDNGFDAVEFMFTEGTDATTIARMLDENGLKQVLANIPLPAGGKGLGAVPGQEDQFQADFLRGLQFASECEVPLVHMTCGIVAPGEIFAAQGAFQRNANWAVERADTLGVKVVVEAINQISAPGYFVQSLAHAHELTRQCPGLGYMLDIYHAAIGGLDPVCAVSQYAQGAAHVQLAGYPHRNEPDRGSLALPEIANALVASQYSGWVGCEYAPSAQTLEGLAWVGPFKKALEGN